MSVSSSCVSFLIITKSCGRKVVVLGNFCFQNLTESERKVSFPWILSKTFLGQVSFLFVLTTMMGESGKTP